VPAPSRHSTARHGTAQHSTRHATLFATDRRCKSHITDISCERFVVRAKQLWDNWRANRITIKNSGQKRRSRTEAIKKPNLSHFSSEPATFRTDISHLIPYTNGSSILLDAISERVVVMPGHLALCLEFFMLTECTMNRTLRTAPYPHFIRTEYFPTQHKVTVFMNTKDRVYCAQRSESLHIVKVNLNLLPPASHRGGAGFITSQSMRDFY
jgi:hypothetical protein